jgi:NAD(P)-dependent dehydrogenase (short-subunit alcohol dehydrogenase family)
MNIVITGASSGIGYETARILAKDGNHSVLAISRNRQALEKLKSNEAAGNIHILPFDIVKGNYEKELIPLLESLFSRVDCLVNNAGKLVGKPFEMLEDRDFDDIFSTNVKAIYRMTRALLPYLAENAHIVNIGSMGGVQGSVKFPGLSLYSASKGAVAILTECLAEEFKGRKIKVNCLALGSAQTNMLSMAFPGFKSPLSAAEMAEFVAFFALNGHQWFNGKVLPVALTTP